MLNTVTTDQRVIAWFSCGAASAAATYLARKKYKTPNFEAVYCRVAEEHKDNFRFLNDFSSKFTLPIKIIGDASAEFSIYKVFVAKEVHQRANGRTLHYDIKERCKEKIPKRRRYTSI